MDGIDLMPIFSDKIGSMSDREFLMHFPHSHRSSYFTAFRKGDWKLIYHYDKTSGPSDDKVELFNLIEDRNESTNLASANPEKLQEMMQAMNAALEDADAQYPTTGENGTPDKPSLYLSAR